MQEEQLLKVKEADKLLGLSSSTIRKMLWDGRLRRIKIGGATRVRKQEIDDLIFYGYQPVSRKNPTKWSSLKIKAPAGANQDRGRKEMG